jgi:hypothetical protein
MVIFCDEVQHHLIFRPPLRAVAGTLAHLFGPTSAGCTTKGGVSTSTTCSVAAIEVHQPKLLSLDLNFAPTTYLRTDLRRSVQGSVCFSYFPRAITYIHAVCDRPMWGARISIWDDHVHTRTKVACEVRGHAEIREDIVKRPTALQLAITSGWSRGLYSRPRNHQVRVYERHVP